MRGRNKTGLRVGGVAVLGFCLGGVGCQASRPLVSLDDGSGPRIIASTSASVFLGETTTQTPVSLEAAASDPTAVERPGNRPVLARLLRPTAPTISTVISPGTSVIGLGQPTGVASSSWAPLQRDESAAVAAAGWQNKTQSQPLPKGVTPPPSLDPDGKQKPTPPEPGLLPQPRPMSAEPGQGGGPEILEGPVGGHGYPYAPGPKAPHELDKVSLPAYVIGPPDILLIETLVAPEAIQKVTGQHLVRPDGTIGLGVYGPVYVAGLTLEQAREAVAQAITNRLDADALKEMRAKGTEPKARHINVDVIAYNSQVYYVITDGGGFGETVRRFPVTGGETVLDAISHIEGLPAVASKKRIWIARRSAGDHGPPQVLPVNWIAITQGGQAAANYQVMPGDRIYVHSQGLVRADSLIGKVLSPIERLFGGALLGSSTVNSIRGRGLGFGNTGVR